ncbi:MAG: aminotransferase class I/II-fold pyridoxal phosphate-dependent enzyme [bacterium]|nr:aminotransferase class I/II-fold pyridoxal phosphate-dependent enzyme [bacterium]
MPKHLPYSRALNDYAVGSVLRLHLPGHGGGRWVAPESEGLLPPALWPADTVQVLDLDDIHYPFGPLGRAQELTSRLYGADRCWFLVNGSTVGILAMALAALAPEDCVIIPRSAHRSIHNAVLLSGAYPLYAPTPYDDFMETAHCVEAGAVQRLLSEHGGIKACLFESLNGYGAAADVKGVVGVLRENGVLALADEAWGAHLIASPELPASACEAGADLAVQSAHKTLNALGQGAWLLQYGSRVEPARVAEALRSLQTSSPSSLITASLDLARYNLEKRGREEWERTVRLARQARERIAEETIFSCPLPQGAVAYDPTRVAISGRGTGCDGQLLECRLRYRHNIQVDMSDLHQTLISLTPAHTEADLDRLIVALREVGEVGRGQSADIELPSFPAWEAAEMAPRQAWQASREWVAWEKAAGRVSAGRIVTYPPGISLVCPGERFTAEQVEYLRRSVELGLPVEGINEEGLVACVG